jgi:hypothetical protein
MALAKTVTYTPFNKTSFGYTNNQIQTDHPTLTNVKVIISGFQGNWDATGHISTPSSGSAVASYNKQKFEWSCEGSVADVDGVLDALDLFPADFPAVRTYDLTTNPTGWTTTATKTNQTTGNYTNENPADTDSIPDTTMHIELFNPDNSYASVIEEVIRFQATQPTFGKQRPYWSTVPSNEDASSSGFSLSTGGLLNLGEISQLNPTTNVSDTDPLTVTCEFRSFSSSSPYTGSAYGTLTTTSNGATNKIFIGDKKPGTENTTTRINFTGTKAEVQAYLDNVRYYRCVGATPSVTPSTFVPNYAAFKMYFKLSNGVVASEYTKHIYFSDAVIGLTGLDTTQSYVEDTAIIWDFGDYTTSGVSPDADEFKAIITLNSVGKGGVDTFTSTVLGTNTTAVYSSTTGALTITSDTESKLKDALRSIQFTPEDDFNATNWTMSVQLNYTGLVNGSSYTSTAQTVTVTSGGNVAEINYQNNTHNWTEDTVCEFSVGGVTGNPVIAHLGDSLNWSMALTLSDATAGSLVVPSPTSTYGTMTPGSSGSGLYTLTGTKTQVNAGLAAMQYIPAADYDTSFTIGFAADRTSGNLEHNAIEYGTYTMTATAVGEYSISQATNLAWNEDESKTFNSGLAITDTATDDSRLPQHGSNYRVEIAMWLGTEFTDGTIVSNYTTNLTVGGAGNQNGQGDTNMISYTGPKDDVNLALASLRFIPNVDYSGGGPNVFYKIVRVSDGAVLLPQSNSTRTEFATGTGHDEISYTHTADLNWLEDTPKLFDTGVQITDKADENSDYSQNNSTYTASLQLKEWDSPYTAITTASIGVLSTITGLTMVVNSSGTTISGTKTQVNLALQSLKMIPDMDWLASPVTGTNAGKFFTYIEIIRDSDSAVIAANNVPPYPYVGFNPGTDSTEFETPNYSFLTFNEDTPKTIFNGLTVAITDAAADNFPNITYEFTLSLSDDGSTAANTAGEWTGTGSHIKVLTGTKAVVNAAIQALSFTPTMDYSSNPYILFALKRYVSGTLNQTYTILGKLVTGTASPLGDYYTGITGMGYTEDLQAQSIFSGHDIGVSDIAADNYSGLTYEVTVTIPSAAGEFVSTGNQTFTTTGTKTAVNTALQNLTFSPTADYNTNFNVTYTQKRYVSGVLDTTHANAVNVGTVTATPVAEFAHGTANSNIQYIVPTTQVPTSTGQVLSPKNLTENWSKTYERPITIIDTAVDGGTTNYKIVFTVPSGTTLYDNTDTSFNGTLDWDTRDNIHTKLDQGIRISGATADLTLSFTLYRKLGTNVEDTLGTGTLTYHYLDIPDALLTIATEGHEFDDTQRATNLVSNDTVYIIKGNSIQGWNHGSAFRVKDATWTTRPGNNAYTVADLFSNFEISNSPFTSTFNTVSGGGLYEVNLRFNDLSTPQEDAQVYNRDVSIVTHYGTKRVLTNIDFNATGHSDIDYPTAWIIPTPINYSKSGDTHSQNFKQSGYHHTSAISVDVQAVEPDGDIKDLANYLSTRILPYAYSPTLYSPPVERLIPSTLSPNGYITGFYMTKDGSNNRIINARCVNGTLAFQPPSYQITDLNAYGSDDDDVSITQIVTAGLGSSSDTYVLVMAEKGSSTKSATIVKLNYNSSTQTHTWSTIKTITLGSSTEYYSIEAFLTDDFSRLITIQSQYNNLAATGDVDIDSSIYTDDNRIRVYDKDTGGTDNWGLTTTTNYSTSNQQTLTKKKRGLHDVNYGDINGSDTVITNFGHIFKKDQGGTDNWGHAGRLDILLSAGSGQSGSSWNTKRAISHYTNNYIVCMWVPIEWPPSGQTQLETSGMISIFNKTTFARLTSDRSVDKSWPVKLIETSRQSDSVAVHWMHKQFADSANNPNYALHNDTAYPVRFTTILNLTT